MLQSEKALIGTVTGSPIVDQLDARETLLKSPAVRFVIGHRPAEGERIAQQHDTFGPLFLACGRGARPIGPYGDGDIRRLTYICRIQIRARLVPPAQDGIVFNHRWLVRRDAWNIPRDSSSDAKQTLETPQHEHPEE